MTVFAFIARAIDETEFVNEPVITTRLQMNLAMAKGLVQGLTKQIAMAEAAKGTMRRRSLRGHARDLLDGLAPIHPQAGGRLQASDREAHMRVMVSPDGDRVEVTTEDDQRFTFPITELQAARRPPRVDNRADDLPIPGPLRVLEDARRAAVEFAILNDLM